LLTEESDNDVNSSSSSSSSSSDHEKSFLKDNSTIILIFLSNDVKYPNDDKYVWMVSCLLVSLYSRVTFPCFSPFFLFFFLFSR
jgi:hypothetical protein